MKYQELVKKLGEPENYSNVENNKITYLIMEDYGGNIDPVETKILEIKLTEDSLLEDYKIVRWKN